MPLQILAEERPEISGLLWRSWAIAAAYRCTMYAFNLETEQVWDPERHVEKILETIGGGDVTIACWEPGQCSPHHCHPEATEIYFCYTGGGTMRTPDSVIEVVPGSFVVHPPGELHEYENGPARSLLFRVRYGNDMRYHSVAWRGQSGWQQSPEDAAYFAALSSAPAQR
jgi:quercetin dioxygenase-like cupin family protein